MFFCFNHHHTSYFIFLIYIVYTQQCIWYMPYDKFGI